MDKQDILKIVKEDGVKFVSFQFSDVTGSVKSVDAPVEELGRAIDNGIWFDGSSVEGFARIQESDMHLRLDLDTYAVLPWTPPELRRARFFCEIRQPDGTPFPGDPRGVLKRLLAVIAKKGWIYNVGPEPEFFLFRQNGTDSTHPVPHDVGGYFDFSPNDEAVQVRTELMSALRAMGLEVEVGHHEVATGQHEIDFRFADALRAADNVLTLKYAVKAIAVQHGLVASFMPKPIHGVNGSGMHCHQSLSDQDGMNLFFDAKDQLHLSPLAYRFMAGQLAHARGFSAVVAPTVNSYKRLVPGYEAPVYIGWAQINRSALIRIPSFTAGQDGAVRMELRCPDSSGSPHLAFAAMLAAGLDGIEHDLPLPESLNEINVYELSEAQRTQMGIPALPGSLAEALAELEQDAVVCAALGGTACTSFLRAKQEEWEEYRLSVSDWEIARYLEVS